VFSHAIASIRRRFVGRRLVEARAKAPPLVEALRVEEGNSSEY
jgi:hypothetical protein